MGRPTWVFSIAATAALGGVWSARAHPGPRVWIGSQNNTLVTYASNNDLSPSAYFPSRVFIGGADEETLTSDGLLKEFPVAGTGIFATEFPGYQVRLDGNSGIATGSTFGFNLAGPLLVYDVATSAFKTAQFKFGMSGPAPRMSESAGSMQVFTGNGTVTGFNFYSYNTSSDHAHLTTTLYGNGLQAVDGPHVVYAVPMQLTGGGKNASKPYYILYGRDISLDQAEFQSALTIANQVLPRLPGDANLDGRVNSLDFDILATNFNLAGRKWQTGDFNFDDVSNALDFNLLATNFGAVETSPSSALSSVVPEPASAMLLSAALLCTRRRCSRKD